MMQHERLSSSSAGGTRRMHARWTILGQVVLKTAAHFGGDDVSGILRDACSGGPLLPGTSLAGAMRSHLADVLGGYRSSKEHPDAAMLFGAARSEDEGSQSPLIVFDSLGELNENMKTELRDGVAIVPKTGTAEPRKKFELEMLPPGTVFPVRADLVVERAESEAKLLSLLAKTLEGFQEGDIFLGMRRSRGMGEVGVQGWRAVRHDLTTQEGWMSWLTSDHCHPFSADAKVHDDPSQAMQAACPSLVWNAVVEDQRHRMVVDLDLELVGDLLVRSPGGNPGEPDAVHLCSGGRPVLPGTSLAGALRARALRIALLMRGGEAGDGNERVNQLFGFRPPVGSDEDGSLASASKLRIAEAFVEKSAARRPTRIAIDRFTGGVARGALFEEQTCAGGRLKVRLVLRNPTPDEAGLLLLVVKDVLSGQIAVGGSVSVGRGVVRGTAEIRLDDGTQCVIASDLRTDPETTRKFNGFVAAFCQAPPIEARKEEAQA